MSDTFKAISGLELPKEEETLYCGSIYLKASGENEAEIEKLSKKERQKLLMNTVNLNHLSRRKWKFIEDLILLDNDICLLEGEKIGVCNTEEHEINWTDNIPVYIKQFPLEYTLKQIAISETKKLIANDLVRSSKSA